jgi:hypothetical protein
MDNYTRHLLLNELDKISSQFNIPISKSKDYEWILENLEISNQNEKSVKKVIQICSLLSSESKNNGI